MNKLRNDLITLADKEAFVEITLGGEYSLYLYRNQEKPKTVEDFVDLLYTAKSEILDLYSEVIGHSYVLGDTKVRHSITALGLLLAIHNPKSTKSLLLDKYEIDKTLDIVEEIESWLGKYKVKVRFDVCHKDELEDFILRFKNDNKRLAYNTIKNFEPFTFVNPDSPLCPLINLSKRLDVNFDENIESYDREDKMSKLEFEYFAQTVPYEVYDEEDEDEEEDDDDLSDIYVSEL